MKEDEFSKGQEKYCWIYTLIFQNWCLVAMYLSIKKKKKSVENDTMVDSEPDLQLTDIEHPPKYFFLLQYSSKF